MNRFDAVTCRGVLNDPVEDGERDAALSRAGFDHIEIAAAVGRRTPDRLLVTARR